MIARRAAVGDGRFTEKKPSRRVAERVESLRNARNRELGGASPTILYLVIADATRFVAVFRLVNLEIGEERRRFNL